MAILGTYSPTLADVAKETNASGAVQAVIEILNETNEIVSDMGYMEANGSNGQHTVTLRSSLPSPSRRAINALVKPSKATSVQMQFNCGNFEAFSEIDCKLADLNGNTAAYRLSQDMAHIESISQAMVNEMFYGNEDTNPDGFDGLVQYYGSTTGATGDNVIDGKNAWNGTAAAAGDDLSSVWVITWSPETIYGIYPKGLKSGVTVDDLGKKYIIANDAVGSQAGGRMLAYVSHYAWDGGLSIMDWRGAVRIANISQELSGDQAATSLVSTTPAFVTLPELIHQACARIPMNIRNKGKTCIYMSAPVKAKFEQQVSRLSAEAGLNVEMVGGQEMTTWHGKPLRVVDALSGGQSTTAGQNEALVS